MVVITCGFVVRTCGNLWNCRRYWESFAVRQHNRMTVLVYGYTVALARAMLLRKKSHTTHRFSVTDWTQPSNKRLCPDSVLVKPWLVRLSGKPYTIKANCWLACPIRYIFSCAGRGDHGYHDDVPVGGSHLTTACHSVGLREALGYAISQRLLLPLSVPMVGQRSSEGRLTWWMFSWVAAPYRRYS